MNETPHHPPQPWLSRDRKGAFLTPVSLRFQRSGLDNLSQPCVFRGAVVKDYGGNHTSRDESNPV